MPKEIINSQGHGVPDGPTSFVEVGWTRDRDVQIASIQPGARVAFLEPESGTHVPTSSCSPGFYVHLDRDGINRMIRSLRKARDAAYGADA